MWKQEPLQVLFKVAVIHGGTTKSGLEVDGAKVNASVIALLNLGSAVMERQKLAVARFVTWRKLLDYNWSRWNQWLLMKNIFHCCSQCRENKAELLLHGWGDSLCEAGHVRLNYCSRYWEEELLVKLVTAGSFAAVHSAVAVIVVSVGTRKMKLLWTEKEREWTDAEKDLPMLLTMQRRWRSSCCVRYWLLF